MIKRDYIERFMDSAQALAISMKDEPLSRARLRGYAQFLLSSAHDFYYPELAKFLEWYGERYLLPKITDLIVESEMTKTHVFHQIVEFGPGTGWLIGHLAETFPHADHYAIDKRPELYLQRSNVTHLTWNLEDADQVQILKKNFPFKNALIVANQFLHCIDHPERIVDEFSDQTWLVVEVDNDPILPHWALQMKQFGASPIGDRDLSKMFEQAGMNGLRRTWRSPMPGLVLSLFEPK